MLFKLALDNIRRSFKNYWAYFLSSAFSTFVLYLFLSVTFGKATSAASAFQSTKAVFNIGAVLAAFFTVFFIWYSNSFFIKTRKKELATYMLLGMSKKQTIQLCLLENLFILALAYATGILAGILLNKFLIMLLMSIMQVHTNVPFEISLQAFKICSLVFLGVFALISIHSAMLLGRKNLIDLINASKKAEKILKVSPFTYVIAVVALGFLGLGYLISVFAQPNPLLWVPIVLFVCIGTLLFFTSVAALFFHFSRKNKAKLYSGTKLITISQLMHRYRGNVGALSVIAITTSVALCAVLTCCSLFNKVAETSWSMRPFSVEYRNTGNNADSIFSDTLKNHPETTVKSSVNVRLLKVEPDTADENDIHSYYLVSQSTYNEAMKALDRANRADFTSDKDCILVQSSQQAAAYDTITFHAGGAAYPFTIVRAETQMFITVDRFRQTLVVKDSVYDAIQKVTVEPEVSLTEIMLANNMLSGSFTGDLHKNLPAENKPLTFYDSYMDGLALMGVMMFVGIFIGLLFVAATGSILYFRMIMEATEDREKFNTLIKLGVSTKELRSAVAKQLAIVFGAPLVLACVNTFAALFQLQKLLNMINTSMMGTFLLVVAVYSLFFGLYYLVTLNKYVKTVGGN